MSEPITVTIYHRDYDQYPKPLISSVRYHVAGGHAHVSIWNRGGLSGVVVVNADDVVAFVARLIPMDSRQAEANDAR